MTTIINADCLQAMREMPDSSVDAITTDPPYGLSNTTPEHIAETIAAWVNGDREYVPDVPGGFMGAAWDAFVPPPAVWDECRRVLKPGGHMAVFAGTRTLGLMDMSIRLAGFDHRDTVGFGLGAWVTGQGFPKSLDIGKKTGNPEHDGLGTALKPSWEPILMYRKPFKGTVSANVEEHGTGGLNIAATRIKPADKAEVPFFYSAKAPKKERPVVDGVQHPTVKPRAVISWILKLTCPPGGTVLDPFAGSGTTVEAAILEGFNPVGIEAHAPYIPLIHQRVQRAEQGQAALNIA